MNVIYYSWTKLSQELPPSPFYDILLNRDSSHLFVTDENGTLMKNPHEENELRESFEEKSVLISATPNDYRKKPQKIWSRPAVGFYFVWDNGLFVTRWCRRLLSFEIMGFGCISLFEGWFLFSIWNLFHINRNKNIISCWLK